MAAARLLLLLLLPPLLRRQADFGANADEYCCPQHKHTQSEMWQAIKAVQPWMILHLYERGDLDIEEPDENGLTPLFYYAKAGDIEMVKFFLNLGAKYEVIDPATNLTVLYDCTLRGYIDICRLMLKLGADPDVYDNAGMQPIWYAVRNQWWDMIYMLLDFNATAEAARDYRNYSPLSLAAIVNRIDIANLLLEHGADPHVLKEEVPNYKGKLSIISVCHKPGWLPENPTTGKCQEWQPGFIITLEAILKAHAFYDMVELLEDALGIPHSDRAIAYVGSGIEGTGTQGI